MSKNNKSSSTLITVLITAAATLGIGYFLFRTSPQNASQQPNGKTALNSTARSANSAQLNSLTGNQMPAIQLTDKDGKAYTNENFKGKYTVLFFNEGLMCYPACWNQIAAFGSDQRFNSDKVQAISVVLDAPSEWQKAIQKMPQLGKSTTMFDTAGAASQLGLLTTTSSMHKGVLPGHTYILIDPEGIVRFVLDDPTMSIGNGLLYNEIEKLNQ